MPDIEPGEEIGNLCPYHQKHLFLVEQLSEHAVMAQCPECGLFFRIPMQQLRPKEYAQ